MQFIDTSGGIYPWSISTKETTTTTTITTNSSKVSHHFIHYWSRGEIEKSRLQSIPYLLIFLLFSFSCRMTLVYDASSKRLWFRRWKRFIPKYKCITLLAKKLRVGEKKSQFSRQETKGKKKGAVLVRMFQFLHYWFCK